MKKMVASVGIAAAAAAGALFLGGSPASAETTQASAQAGIAHVQTVATSTDRHYGDHRGHHRDYRDHRWDYYYRHHHHHHGVKHHFNVGHHHIVIKNSNTNVAISH
jgi:hypothetical protein